MMMVVMMISYGCDDRLMMSGDLDYVNNDYNGCYDDDEDNLF